MKTEVRRRLQPLWNQLDRVVLPHASAIALAVSGGPDSSALIHACHHWMTRSGKRRPSQVRVYTVDHNQHGQSAQVAESVVALARSMDLPATSLKSGLAPGAGEAQMRKARYALLIAEAKKDELQAVVTGHHADDDAEGLVLDLVGQGGGRGGAAMPERHERDGILILRPFSQLHRAQLADALGAAGGQALFVDPADQAGQNARARIRQGLLPLLGKFHPEANARLALLARRRRDDEEALLQLALPHIQTPSAESRARLLDLAEIPPRAILRRAIMEMLKQVAPARDPRSSSLAIDQIVDRIAAGAWKTAHFDLSGAKAELSEGALVIRPNA
jgi:tRNA(Ile)-lysidine synthase